jgi:TonB-linked SusC/RagA family outer membrane protein
VAAGLALVAWVVFTVPAHAQTGEISGRVVDATTNEPIEQVQVVVVGSNISARSRSDGLYNLVDVPVGTHYVRAAVIGYSTMTAEVNVGAGLTTTVDFALNRAVISLDAMVVTGQAGEVSRREIGNTIAQVSSRDFENLPTPTVGDVLQGTSSSAMVMDNSGMVGVGKMIRLRGINSISMGNIPLIYVDGVRISNLSYQGDPETNQAPSPLNDINPEDIDRVEIIKGAAATTLYGTQASAGVIQIFTKRGSTGRPRWSFVMDQGLNTLPHVGPSKDINPTGLGMNCNFTGTGSGPFATGDPMFPADSSCPSSGKWDSNGWVQRYNLGVRGGGPELNYFVSGRFAREEGTVSPQFSEDYAIRGNFGFAPSRTFTITFNNMYARRRIRWIPDGNNAEGFTLNVWRGENDYTPGHQDSVALEMKLWQTSNHFTSGLGFTWDPIPGMTHRLNLGLDYAESDYTEQRDFGFWRVALGSREDDQYQARTLTLDYAGSWQTRISNSFQNRFSFGAQLYEESLYGLSGYGDDFAGPGDKLVDNAAITSAEENRFRQTNGGFFFQEELGFQDRLFLTAGIRFDGFSTFGEDYGMAAYPKLSAAYTLSDAGWFPGWWEGLKLRAAWGESGRAPGVFDAVRTWEPVAGDEARPAVTPSTLGNDSLGPERSREFELGFDGSMFAGRVGFEFTWFNQRTYDALVPVQQIPSTGFIGTQLVNTGTLENKGFETSLNVGVIRSNKFDWDLGIRYGNNDSKAIDLGGLEALSLPWRQEIRPCTDGEGNPSSEILDQETYRANPECPVPGLWQSVVTNDSAPGFTPLGTLPVMETRYIGPTYPRNTWGFTTSFRFGRLLTLDAVGEAQLGHFLYAGTSYQNARRWVWPECREIVARYDAEEDAGGTGTDVLNAWESAKCVRGYTTYGMWGEPADFFKLRTVSAAFFLPTFIPGTRAITLLVQGRNLLTITDFPGADPEASEDGSRTELGTSDGLVMFRQEYYQLPPYRSLPYRSFIISLKLEF